MVSSAIKPWIVLALSLGRWLVLFSLVLVASSPSWALECPECPHPPPDVTCPAFDPTDPLLGAHDRAAATPSAGTISGAFSVSSTGEAVYRLSLVTPSGRAGMEPQLSLTYDSASGEGPFGVGFSLQGLSSITRCPSTVAEDGQLRGVRYDEQDHFCLDGLRLVAVGSAEHAADGSYVEYRTRPDTFRRVRAYHAFGADPASSPTKFVAWTKSGRIVEYGVSPSGRVMGKHGSIRAWWVTRERDRHDNAVDTSYRNELDPGDGHTVTHVPLRIDYTSHLSEPLKGPSRAVTFTWTDWDYHTTIYTGGMALSRRPHIEAIRMLGPGDAVVRSYRFTWDLGLTQRGRISTIRECAADDLAKCRPPTRLTWMAQLAQPGEGFTVTDTGMPYPSPQQDDGFLWMMADVTGDGLSDLVTHGSNPADNGSMAWNVARNLGGGFGPPDLWATTGRPGLLDQPNVGSNNPDFRQFDVFPHDYDQDGVTDLFYDDPTGGEIHWLRADPVNRELDDTSAGLTLPAPLFADWYPPKPLYADLDGDGVLDQIQCHQLPLQPNGATVRGSWEVRRWTPSGFGAATPLTPLGDTGCGLHRFIHVVDLDRDGKSELLVPSFGYAGSPPSSPDCGGLCVYRAVGLEIAPDGVTLWTVRDTFLPAPNWAVGSGRVIFADVNGDGLPDAIEASNLAGLSSQLGRLTLQQDSNGVTLFHSDDPQKGLGRLSEVLSPGGQIESYVYDGLGRLNTTTLTLDGESFSTSYGYDPQGRLSTVAYPSSASGAFRIKNGYDARGNLISVQDDLSNAAPFWQLLEVDGEGRTSREHFGDGTDTTRKRFADKGTLEQRGAGSCGEPHRGRAGLGARGHRRGNGAPDRRGTKEWLGVVPARSTARDPRVAP